MNGMDAWSKISLIKNKEIPKYGRYPGWLFFWGRSYIYYTFLNPLFSASVSQRHIPIFRHAVFVTWGFSFWAMLRPSATRISDHGFSLRNGRRIKTYRGARRRSPFRMPRAVRYRSNGLVSELLCHLSLPLCLLVSLMISDLISLTLLICSDSAISGRTTGHPIPGAGVWFESGLSF